MDSIFHLFRTPRNKEDGSDRKEFTDVQKLLDRFYDEIPVVSKEFVEHFENPVKKEFLLKNRLEFSKKF